ncbi:MAG: NAD-dependent epimerase/dehydratase family protein [Nocardioides sp.]|uniref:NAD-dependent epimerase/dehydratase family protein n=1 Tax=Nocardioides sp. TaxID=35761 RepID=UPI0026194A40|nr:NAD-dependent epimerase/dehydratase family protein [Nocardioides sp.]MCW2832607.1 NAD-dependent epimerase/dehydratase family protein [Nocardioides sp.]
MRILITGGAGFIGRRLIGHVRGLGHDVIVVDAGFTGVLTDVPDDCRLVERDIASITGSDWDELLAGCDIVFHLAARKYNTPGVTAEQLIATNVNATWQLAQAAARASVSRLVFTSSLYAYGALGPDLMRETDVPLPRTLYGSSKLMGEHILRTVGLESGLSWNCARLFFVYGPGQYADGGYKSVIVTNLERMAAGLAPTICGDGEQALDYVYVDDAVEALWTLATAEPTSQVLNVASGRARSINDLTAAMIGVVGEKFTPETLAADWTAGTSRAGDPSLCRTTIGWSATSDLATGLAGTWHTLRRDDPGR